MDSACQNGWYFLLFHFPAFLIESHYLLQQDAKGLLYYSIITFGLQQILFFYPILTHIDFKYSFYGLVLFGILKYIWLIINILQKIRFGNLQGFRCFLLLLFEGCLQLAVAAA